MKTAPTSRGFLKGSFVDGYGFECSLQESSAMNEEGYIWLGIDEAKPEYCPMNGTGWHPLPLPDCVAEGMSVLFHTRMHLSQTDVKKLLPALKYFAKHGTLPESDS